MSDLEKIWSIKEVKSNPRVTMTKDEIECVTYFRASTSRNEIGRFIVKLRLNENFTSFGRIGTNGIMQIILNRKNLIRTRKIIRAFMHEYEELRHMTDINISFS